MTTFHSLTVARIEQETPEAVAITFAVPPDLQAHYAFKPGQHLTLKTRLGGEELRRCYSICRAEQPGEICVAVKAIDGGRFSQYALTDLVAGTAMDVMIPQGIFGYQPQPATTGNYLALAVGSGITPMLAIVSATLATEANSRVTLVYGNRSSRSMMFRQALADLKDRYTQRLQLIYLFSQEVQESELLSGRLDGAKVKALGDHLLDVKGFDRTFICGPQNMMQETEAALLAMGVAKEAIFIEHFNTPGTAPSRERREQAAGKVVTLRLDGRERKITLDSHDESILDAALRQGADLPYACKGGVCATCRCKVVSGEVEMGVNYSLEPDQLAAGYILSCQSLPKGNDVVIDFDAQGL